MEAIDDTIRDLPGFEDATLLRDARMEALKRMSTTRAAGLGSDRALERAGIHRRASVPRETVQVA